MQVLCFICTILNILGIINFFFCPIVKHGHCSSKYDICPQNKKRREQQAVQKCLFLSTMTKKQKHVQYTQKTPVYISLAKTVSHGHPYLWRHLGKSHLALRILALDKNSICQGEGGCSCCHSTASLMPSFHTWVHCCSSAWLTSPAPWWWGLCPRSQTGPW